MLGFRGPLLAGFACAAGIALAVVVGSAGADSTASVTTTLGSTTGSPSQNICSAGFDCTYIPFSSAANPTLAVPVDGSVTSFSVNAGSAGSPIALRVLRPAANGQYTGAGTSPTETTAGGPQTFTVSLPVQAGDVLALDNSSSALLFDNSSANPVFTAYYQPASSGPPGLPDGSTAAPDTNKMGFRVLLSAVVTGIVPTTSTGTTTGTNGTVTVSTTVTSTSTVTTTRTVTTTKVVAPVIGNPTQSRSRWSLRQGTTFAFGLSTSAKVEFVFKQHVGRRNVQRGTHSMNGRAGTNRFRFNGRLNGKKLHKGRYTVTITASNQTGTSRPSTLSFTVTG